MFHAIDVSHHQNPGALDWAGMRAAGCDACIVRLTYGTMKDERAKEHIRHAREAGFAIGAYAFARTVQPIRDQYKAFEDAAAAADYGREDDIVPALDIEDDTAARPILPAHAPLFDEYQRLLGAWQGQPCYAYITQRDWGRLGRPGWVLQMPLFVAHYAPSSRTEPATPNGMPWSIWQHRVGPFELDGPSGYYTTGGLQIDQSRVRSLRFLNGQVFDSTEPSDAEIRGTPDPEDGTHLLRQERLEQSLRAEATDAATESRFQNLEDLRRSIRQEQDTLDEEEPERLA
jgi:Glycosyl hydrolases family 25